MNGITIDDIMAEVVGEASKAPKVEVIQPAPETKPEIEETLEELTSDWNRATIKRDDSSTSETLNDAHVFMQKEEVMDFFTRRVVSEAYMSFALHYCFGVSWDECFKIGKELAKKKIPGHLNGKYKLEQEIKFFTRAVATLKCNNGDEAAIADAGLMLRNRLSSLSTMNTFAEMRERKEQEESMRKYSRRNWK